MQRINRRDFMTTSAAAGILAAARPLTGSSGPTVITQGATRPVIVSSANGHRFLNGGNKTCVQTAFGAGRNSLSSPGAMAKSGSFFFSSL